MVEMNGNLAVMDVDGVYVLVSSDDHGLNRLNRLIG